LLPFGRREEREGRPKVRRGVCVKHLGCDGRSEFVVEVRCIVLMVRTPWRGRFKDLGLRRWIA
jgi:hypothetical protein